MMFATDANDITMNFQGYHCETLFAYRLSESVNECIYHIEVYA